MDHRNRKFMTMHEARERMETDYMLDEKKEEDYPALRIVGMRQVNDSKNKQ